MTEELLLWRCLHGGPLTCLTLEQWPAHSELPWARFRERNLSLLRQLTRVYGACAILARDGERIVGHLRFYPRAIWARPAAGGLCLQQDPPAGPEPSLADGDFPPLAQLTDRTLAVHCLMTGSPIQPENPYQRKGLGSRMVRCLIEWATARGWECIEARSFEDLPIIYEITGSAGVTFWEKLGFTVVERHPHPELQAPSSFVRTLEAQAVAAGLPAERARDELILRRWLRPPAQAASAPVSGPAGNRPAA